MAKIITESEFRSEVLDNSEVVVVDFFADWCPPCRMLSPVLEKISHEYTGKANVVKVNADHEPTLSGSYRVTGLPTMVFFKNGAEVKRMVGFHSESAIKKTIDSLVEG